MARRSGFEDIDHEYHTVDNIPQEFTARSLYCACCDAVKGGRGGERWESGELEMDSALWGPERFTKEDQEVVAEGGPEGDTKTHCGATERTPGRTGLRISDGELETASHQMLALEISPYSGFGSVFVLPNTGL